MFTVVVNCPQILIIGGGIANFTDVAKTFTGIAKALREAKQMLHVSGAFSTPCNVVD